MVADDGTFEDAIYECAFVPELWPSVLDRLATIAGARGGCFVSGNTKALRHWTASPGIESVVEDVFVSGAINKSQRLSRTLGSRHAGFIRDHLAYTEQEFARDVLYRDHLWPAGLGFATGTAFCMPTGETLIISFERDRAEGPVEAAAVDKLDMLRPHIARSVYLSARQDMTRANDAAHLLAQLNLPAVVLDAASKAIATNALAEHLMTGLIWRSADRIAFKDRTADDHMKQAMATIGVNGTNLRSFVVRGSTEVAAMIAHVLPLRGSSREIFARSAAVLILTPAQMPQAPPMEMIQSLFDLTPAEARVARNIVVGHNVEKIASSGGVSPHTVRSQVKSLLAKTGCRRQAEVASLFSGIRHFGAPASEGDG